MSIWDDVNYNVRKIKNTSMTNNKQFLKTVRLDDHPITTIICKKYYNYCSTSIYLFDLYIETFSFRYIITGNTNGDLYFYDKSLCVLYHLNKFVGDPITSIAMLNIDTTLNNKNCMHLFENL